MNRLVLPSGVGVSDEDGVVYVAPLPDGPITVLDGASALIWREARRGDLALVAERVARHTDHSADEIRRDVDAVIETLVERGLLVVRD